MEPPLNVTSETSVYRAARLMTEHDLARVPVVDGGALVGTLGYEDVTRRLRRPDADEPVSMLVEADPPALAADDPDPPESPPVGEPAGGFDHAGPFEPDVLMPSQYLDRVRRRTEYDPERRLMVAVLRLGVGDYLKHAGARDPKSREVWREVEVWVEDRDPSWIFSFENICHVLELDPDYVRRGLRAAKEAGGRAVPGETSPNHPGSRTAARARRL